MSEQIKDGGRAFPEPGVYDISRDQINPVGAYYDAGGMSLRDYFAAKALQGAAAGSFTYSSHRIAADDAYLMADAMLAAREAKP